MKLMALFGAGALAAGLLASAPAAEAQRYGDRAYRYDGGGRGYGYRGDYRHRAYGYRHRGYGFRDGYGYRGGYGRRGYYGRPRVVCRVRPGRFGPVRRCFDAY